LEIIDLSPAYAAVQDRNTLVLARWDDHTTALGHRLLAETLHKNLMPLLSEVPTSGGPTALKSD
jgi:hypothetical protein